MSSTEVTMSNFTVARVTWEGPFRWRDGGFDPDATALVQRKDVDGAWLERRLREEIALRGGNRRVVGFGGGHTPTEAHR
jgi:hypothetical protein